MVIKGEGVGGGDDDDDEDSKNHGESCSSSYSSDWVLITAELLFKITDESHVGHQSLCEESR